MPATPQTAPPLLRRTPHSRGLASQGASKPAPFLPTSRAEMDALGWDACDVILVTGDAYIDHPSFGMALVGRLLEAQGFRVGIITQPDWQSPDAFRDLGRPLLYFGVTAGNMDSMVNRYTSDRRIRSNDAYTPGGEGGKRPDRSVIVYSQRCREAFKGVSVVIGGIEASLRRIAHFDYWSEKVRRSVLLDSKADILLYGNAERALVELTCRMADGEAIGDIADLRGTAVMRRTLPDDVHVIDGSDPEAPLKAPPGVPLERLAIRLPAFEQVKTDKVRYAHASRIVHREANPHNARALVQQHGDRELWLNPPPIPLTTPEMDAVYDLPYARAPHPSIAAKKVPAWDMIRFSINIQRGCYGGCTFCSITEHEGRIIQNRSQGSIMREIDAMRGQEGYTGHISDLGGPTANMYRTGCKSPEIEASCRRPSCLFPKVCENLNTDHAHTISLYRNARAAAGVKKVSIASGVRYDLASEDPAYVKELVTHHVGGYLKIAPEHLSDGPLSKMMKPGMGAYNKFKALFDKYSKQAGKKQYLIPYFIAAHPGTTDEDMLELALWLKDNNYKADQVQTFLPSPMATATAMYHTEKNPLRRVRENTEDVVTPKGLKVRRLHKAFLRWHDPENWPLLRQSLKNMGREDLIGAGPGKLIPWRDNQRVSGHSGAPGEPNRPAKRFNTQHTGVADAAFPRGGQGPKAEAGAKPAARGGRSAGGARTSGGRSGGRSSGGASGRGAGGGRPKGPSGNGPGRNPKKRR